MLILSKYKLPGYCLLLVGLLAASCPVLAEIYTWTDADGNTIFSDQPAEGASKIELPPPQTYKPTAIKPGASTPPPGEKTESVPTYRLLDITQPLHDQALWADNGQIDVVLAIEPALAVALGHRISISLDGKMVINKADSTRLTLTTIDRGSHTLSASIQDKNGKQLKNSTPVTFHVHRHSALTK